MNHLAHLRLSPPEPLQRLGNLLGDFVRGHDTSALPDSVHAGIALHRAVDRFTDRHPVFRRSRARVSAPLGRWSGVLVDVFYDHFLARDWHRHGDGRPLSTFTAEVYDQLERQAALLPQRLQRALPRMIDNDWLAACRSTHGVRMVLYRIQQRLRRPAELAAGIDDLAANYDAFAADFAAFYPQLDAFARDYLASNSDASASTRGPSSSQTE